MTDAPAQPHAIRRPCCDDTTQFVQHIELKDMPGIYVFYCSRCQFVETIKEELAA